MFFGPTCCPPRNNNENDMDDMHPSARPILTGAAPFQQDVVVGPEAGLTLTTSDLSSPKETDIRSPFNPTSANTPLTSAATIDGYKQIPGNDYPDLQDTIFGQGRQDNLPKLHLTSVSPPTKRTASPESPESPDVPTTYASTAVNHHHYGFMKPKHAKTGSSGSYSREPEVMIGKWRLIDSNNWKEYLKAAGANVIKRGIMDMENSCVQFDKIDEETFKMTISTTMRRIELTFKLDGQDIEEQTDDGRTVVTKMTWDDGVLTQRRFGKSGVDEGTLRRIFKGDEMELVCQLGDVTARRYYKRDDSCM